MASINIPIVGGAYKDPNTVIACQTCINLYPESVQEGQKVPAALLPTPSVKTLFDLNISAKCRGFAALTNGNIYAVYGQGIYKLSNTLTKMPDVAIDGTNTVIIAENSRYACFVSDAAVYTLDLQTNAWAQYGEQMLYEADDVVTLSQRFIFNRRGTGQIFWTDTLSTNIDPLSFATAESSPDDITALKVHNKQLWIFGELSTEIWYPTGDNNLPFAPMQGSAIFAGCLLRHTIQRFGDSLVWLANTENGNCQIVIAQGLQLQRISNHALEKELRSYDTTDANAHVYQEAGHSFYVINFPIANKTWVYDGSTGLWHQRAIWRNNAFQMHPSKYHAMWRGQHVFAHESKVMMLGLTDSSRDVIGVDVLLQVRERATHAVSRTQNMVRHNRLTLVTQQATSNTNDDPQVMLSWSDDDGITWSDTRWRGIGKRGQYQHRTFWTRLGASRNRAYRVRMTDSATLVITGAELEVN